jgi:hypothetical protein
MKTSCPLGHKFALGSLSSGSRLSVARSCKVWADDWPALVTLLCLTGIACTGGGALVVTLLCLTDSMYRW